MPVDPTAAKTIFLAAAERPAAERDAYLDKACAGDAALRARVVVLLSALDQGSFPDFVADRNPSEETQTATVQPAPGPDTDLPDLLPAREPGHLGRIDRYEIHSIVGRGGMGIVVKALDESLDRIVAIKFLGSRFASNGTARQRFIREAKAVAAIAHEHVVTIHAVDDERPYLVMQYVSGVSLQERIDTKGPLELKEILRIGRQIASGLAAAHKEGLVHRDIKPSNVLLENGVERVKITDFGLARAVDDVSVTASGVIAGTPMYMSPEQARGEQVDARSDLFSLGSLLYAMCTGHAPFRASGTMAVMKRVIEDVPRPIRELNPAIPEWLEAIVARLHEKSPDERFQKATEVEDVLGQRLAHLQKPTAIPRPVPAPHPAPSPRPKVEIAPKVVPAPAATPVPGTGLSNHIWTVLMLLVLLPMLARGSFGNRGMGDDWPSWIGLFGGLGLALLVAVRAARHSWRKQPGAAILMAFGAGALLAIAGGAAYGLAVGETGPMWLIGAIVALCLAGLFVGLGEWRAARAQAVNPAPPRTAARMTGVYWIVLATTLLPGAILIGRSIWFGFSRLPNGGHTALHITWYDPDGDLIVEMEGNGLKSPIDANHPRPINGPHTATRGVSAGDYVVRIFRYGQTVAERKIHVDSESDEIVNVEFLNLPPGDPADWTKLFNGQHMTHLMPADNSAIWNVENGVLVGREGMVIGDRDDWEDFHLWAEVKVNVGGKASLFVRFPNSSNSFEITLGASALGNGSLKRRKGNAYSIAVTELGGRSGEWLAIEVIARGSLIVTRVNGRGAAQAVGADGPLARGRLAITVAPETELHVRQLLIKTLPVGTAPLPASAPFPATVAPWYQEAWAAHLKRKVIEDDGAGVRLVLIPPGECELGTATEDVNRLKTEWQTALNKAPNPNPWRTWELAPLPSEGPRRHVRVTRPFYLGAQEVTVAQYRDFVTATKYQTEAEVTGLGGYAFNGSGWLRQANINWKEPGRDWKSTDKHPVVQVTRADAEKFCEWLSRKEGCVYRLPTEAEWEYACRAGTNSRYSFGDAAGEFTKYGWAGMSDMGHPGPVAGKSPNPWGLYDMHGNVQEWCARGFQGAHYSVAPTTDPPDLGHNEPAVMRGGGWANHALMCRSAARLVARPDKTDDHTGFRVLREVPTPPAPSKLVLLHSFTPGKDPLPVPLRGGVEKAVALDGEAWRIENATNAGNYHARIGELLDNVPKDGILVLRAKVKVKASDKLAWGGLNFGGANHIFVSWDQWPADKARYDGANSDWTEREVRQPAAEFHKVNPPAVYLYAGFHANGVFWLKDVELLHEPAR